MVAFTAFFLLSQASTKVSLLTDGMRLEAIVKDLSAQSGVPLSVSARLKNEIVIVKAQDVPVRDLMDRIAQADGAEWKPSGGGFNLDRSRELEKAQIAEEAVCRTEALRKRFDETVASHVDPKGAEDPSSYLAWMVAQKLGPEVLANFPRGVRVVWTENPNLLQHRLGFSPRPLIEAYIKHCKMLRQEALADQAQNAVRMEVSGVATILNGCDLRVKLRDAQGSVVSIGSLEIPPYGPDSIEPPSSGTPNGPNDKPLELSETAEMLRKVASEQMGGHISARPSGFDAVAFHPEKVDPLALFPADVAGVLAKRGDRALVAVIPDFAMLTGIFFGTGKLYERDARQWLDRICVIDESRPGWMVLHPRLPIDARTLRADRVAMGKFYRTARENSGASLAELAAYVATQPRRYAETISFFYGFFCQPELVRMCEPDGLGALRVYGALTPEQRAPLEQGGTLPTILMPPAARAELADWVYNGQWFSGGNSLVNAPDPTDAFPNGLTSGKLTVLISPSPEVVPLYNGHEDLDGDPLSASSLGNELANYKLGTNRIKEPISGFWLGQGIGLQFQFSSANYELNATLSEHRINRKGAPLSFSDLPKEFREQAEQAQKQAMQSKPAAPTAPVERKP